MVVRLPNQPSNKQKHVACYQQKMADGRLRERNLLPSEKMLDGEVRSRAMPSTHRTARVLFALGCRCLCTP